MKQVLFFLLMFCVLGVFAQPAHTVDFEPGGTGADWEWTPAEQAPDFTIMNNPVSGGINTSATVVEFVAHTTDNNWALCFTSDDGEFTFDATNALVKIMVYKPHVSNVGVKFEGVSGFHEINIENTLTNQWEEIEFDFSGQVGNTYNKIVIIPDNIPWVNNGFDRTEDVTLYFDNIQVPDGIVTVDPAPITQPLPQPSASQDNVISVFSDVYTDLATTWHPAWGQGTEYSNEIIEGVSPDDHISKLKYFGYEGITFSSTNVTGMEYVHFDVWSYDETSLKFFLLAGGPEPMVQRNLTTESWNSFDVPLEEFVGGDLSNITGIKLESGTWTWPVGTSLIFMDNIYFWRNELTADDATLSDLLVDGNTVDGFAPDVFSYDVELPFGTVDVPVVTAVTNNPEAGYETFAAGSLPGTTEVLVTAADELTQQSYFVNFTLGEEPGGSAYCETEVFHFGDPNTTASAIYLTITNQDANTVFVEIESARESPVDLLIVTGESGAAISGEDFSVPGKISRTMYWDNPPADVELNILWSFEDFDGNWQLSQTPITVPFDAVCAPPGPTMITFRVDMSEYEGEYTNVYVSGSFNDWSGTDNQLLDADLDNVYEGEFEIADGSYEYKFTLDDWTVQEEFNGSEPCVITIDGYNNRLLEADGSEILPAYCWNSCFECGMAPAEITLSVDMNNYLGDFGDVYVSGSFNDWCGDCNMMQDPEMDGVYETTLTVFPGNYEYKFTLDNWAAQEQFAGGESCTIEIDGYVNRYIEVTENVVVPTVCWNLCDPCPEPVDVTFSVDMSLFEGSYTNVYLSGSFNGWCGDCNQMADPDMDMTYDVTLSLIPGVYEYKFTLDNWAHQEEFEGGEPCTVTNGGFTNRYIEVEETVVLSLVCWNYCDVCPDYLAGWRGISSNLMLESKATMEDVFEPIIDDVVILVSNDGIFWPGYNINTIGDWDTYKGYKIKFENDVWFGFDGVPVEDKTVSLEAGSHYIPVLSEEAALVSDVLAPHADAIVFAFDMAQGTIYWPDGGIVPGVPGALEVLEPGYAYYLLASDALVLDFGSDGKAAAETMVSQPVTYPEGWNTVVSTGSQHILSVKTASLVEGDVIGAFNQNNILTGIAQFSGSGDMMPLVVMGDDQTTEGVEGMIVSEMMSFRIYSNGIEESVQAVYDKSFNHNGRFVENGLSIINEFKAGATGIDDTDSNAFSIYPNPSNGQFNVQVADDSTYDVVVLNVQGQQIYSANLSGNISIELGSQPKGVYFVRVSDNNSVSMEKIVIE